MRLGFVFLVMIYSFEIWGLQVNLYKDEIEYSKISSFEELHLYSEVSELKLFFKSKSQILKPEAIDESKVDKLIYSQNIFKMNRPASDFSKNYFMSTKALDQMNRKTKFKVTKLKNVFLAERKSWLFDIKFELEVEAVKRDQFFKYSQLLNGSEAEHIYLLHYRKYNRFFGSGKYIFVIRSLDSESSTMEILGVSTLNKSIPNFVSSFIGGDIENKSKFVARPFQIK